MVRSPNLEDDFICLNDATAPTPNRLYNSLVDRVRFGCARQVLLISVSIESASSAQVYLESSQPKHRNLFHLPNPKLASVPTESKEKVFRRSLLGSVA